MTKVAIFVEGKTDRKFIEKVIYQRYAGVAAVLVKKMVLRGKNRYFQPISVSEGQAIDCLFLIIETSQVISMVEANAVRMINEKGFAFVMGVRDVIPNRRNEIQSVMNGINRLLSKLTVFNKLSVIFAIMEIEAWFLYDWGLFQRIDSRLTPQRIKEALGVDVMNDDPELQYEHPSNLIDKIFQLVQLRYRKHDIEIDRIVRNIDYNYMFCCNNKISSFVRFIDKLDRCGILQNN